VVLKITQDHLANYDPLSTNFHVSRDAYVEAKRHIVAHQSPEDVVICNSDDTTSASFAKSSQAKQYFFGKNMSADACIEGDAVYMKISGKKELLTSLSDMKMLGSHNLENIGAAALAAHVVNIPLEVMRHVSKTFPGLPHRLEKVAEKKNVMYINDSFSTTPETTIAAIASFSAPIILIAGGSEKGSDFSEMGKAIAQSSVKKVIAIGDMTDRILDALSKAGYRGEISTGLKTMHDMVEEASRSADSGDVVLLSPGCASFGLFPNYKERGSQFTYEVSLL
jgi:UDP-N-acetylmuramoylalanine--D-glutamate ligase